MKRRVDARARPSSTFSAVVVAGVSALLAGYLLMIVVVTPREGDRFLGLGLVAIGCFNLVFHRRFGTQAFSSGRRFARFWDRLGEVASQRIYFVLGVLLVLSGAILLILSVLYPTPSTAGS